MKKHILFLGVLCALSIPAVAQDTTTAEKAAAEVTMKEGTFWPSYEVEGKYYFNGNKLPKGITSQMLLDAGLTPGQIAGAVYTP